MGVYRTSGKSVSRQNPNQKLKEGEYWRNSYNYREEYFKKNPGLFGCIWFCAYCGRPLFGKGQVQVDHVVPPSQFSKKKYDRHGNLIKNTSVAAEALNHRFNLVSACAKCNRKKSDGMGLYVIRGGFAKILQTALFRFQDLLVHSGKLTAKGVNGAVKVGGRAAKHSANNFRKKSGKQKIVSLMVIAVVGICIYFNFFS